MICLWEWTCVCWSWKTHETWAWIKTSLVFRWGVNQIFDIVHHYLITSIRKVASNPVVMKIGSLLPGYYHLIISTGLLSDARSYYRVTIRCSSYYRVTIMLYPSVRLICPSVRLFVSVWDFGDVDKRRHSYYYRVTTGWGSLVTSTNHCYRVTTGWWSSSGFWWRRRTTSLVLLPGYYRWLVLLPGYYQLRVFGDVDKPLLPGYYRLMK